MAFLHRRGSKQFTTILKWIQVYKHVSIHRFCSSNAQKLICERLKHRSLVKLSGKDTTGLLQGLVTNDMRYLDENQNQNCVYSLMLNQLGRIVFDVLLYKLNNDELLLECDSSQSDALIKHIKKYKLRKKVDIIPVEDKFTSWVVFSDFPSSSSDSKVELRLKNGRGFDFQDPRLDALGHRLILQNDIPIKCVLEGVQISEEDRCYTELRYKLGIGEGGKDLPPENCFPLDSNGDLLHGISFQKGCYLGQELTSRTYHTGVVRKRLMPIRLESLPSQGLQIKPEAVIVNEDGKNLGRYRNHCGQYGLAILKIVESLNAKKLIIKDHGIQVTTRAPYWWPKEALEEATH